MKTFLQLSIERKAHEANRVAITKSLNSNETISADYGIYENTSTFEVEVWNKRGNSTIDNITVDVTYGIVSRRSWLSEVVRQAIEVILKQCPTEDTFGVESFNWDDGSGYIYPANGEYGNIAVYVNREELEYYLTLPTVEVA